MVYGTRSAVKKAKSNIEEETPKPKEEETPKPKVKESKDAETQTDPEITGVDADDFEEDDNSSSGEEDDSDAETSEDEAAGDSAAAKKAASDALASKGTGARRVPRKKIELKYYYGEDMPDAEVQRLAEAEVLVPPGLDIRESSIANAGKGVFAKCVIPKHEFFGPYVGKKVTPEEAKHYKDSPYVWEVYDDYGKMTHLVDGRDALQSNWLRYVNCSNGLDEQNIRAVQYDKNIYYMATKEIHIGDELLTYYGNKFAKKFGLKCKKSNVKPGDESFVCKNCGKMYTNPGALIGHLKFKCNTGEQRSIFVPIATGPRALIPKIKVSEEYAREQNEKLKKFKCPTCGKAFIRNYTLQCHLLIHSNVKEHKCEVCQKEFTLLKHLQRHKLVHTGEKPYKCHLCGRAFSQQGSLQAHSRTHTGIKPYECNICGRRFALQSPLLSHIKTHSSEKNYKCEKCNKAFTHRNTLARHELIHSGIRPYKCDQCDKTFTQTNDLKRHSRIHTGIRPYQCHVCSKSFTVEFTLVCHIRTHTGERPYICDHCDKSFTQPGARLKHARKCHPDLPLPTSLPITAAMAATKAANAAAAAAAPTSTTTATVANGTPAATAAATLADGTPDAATTAAGIAATTAAATLAGGITVTTAAATLADVTTEATAAATLAAVTNAATAAAILAGRITAATAPDSMVGGSPAATAAATAAATVNGATTSTPSQQVQEITSLLLVNGNADNVQPIKEETKVMVNGTSYELAELTAVNACEKMEMVQVPDNVQIVSTHQHEYDTGDQVMAAEDSKMVVDA